MALRDLASAQARRLLDRGAEHSTLIARRAVERKISIESLTHEWELPLLADVPRGGLAVDVGAHIGILTSLLANRFAQVIALEPNPSCVNRLQRTMPENVFIIGAAAGDRAGSAELRVPRFSGRAVAALGSLVAPADGAVPVQVHRVVKLRVDDIVSERVDFLKVDVEGFEPEVLAGAQRVLSDRPVVLIEAEQRHRANAPSLVAEALAVHGLTGLFTVDGVVKGFEEFDPAVHQASVPTIDGRTQPDYVMNFLFVPTELRNEWTDRLRRASTPTRA